MFKELVEAVFPVEEAYLKKLPPGADPDDYEWVDDRGYIEVRNSSSKIAYPHLKTCQNFIKAKKPFKKFSWKQFEVILKAIDPKSGNSRGKNTVYDVVYNPNYKDTASYSSLEFPACWCCKWFPEEGYLAVGFWLKDDYAFLKGGKEQTVYIEAQEIEKHYGKKIVNNGLGSVYKVGDCLRVEAKGKKNGKEFADGFVAEIDDFIGPWELSLKRWDMKEALRDASDWGKKKYVELYLVLNAWQTNVGSFALKIKDSLDIPKFNEYRDTPWIDITKYIDLSKVKKFLEPEVNWSEVKVQLCPRSGGIYSEIDHGFKK